MNASGESEKQVAGKIGVPYFKSGLNITLKSASASIMYTSAWLTVENMENKEKPFKIGAGSIIMDSNDQQYEIIKVPRTSEIAQTNLFIRTQIGKAFYSLIE